MTSAREVPETIGNLQASGTEFDDRALGLRVALAIAAAISIAALSLNANLPDGAVRLPDETRQRIRTLLPQGWGYFTRDPRATNQTVYMRGPTAKHWRIAQRPYASTSNLLGWSRAEKTRTAHLNALSAHVPNRYWKSCHGVDVSCFKRGQRFQLKPSDDLRALRLPCGREIGFVSWEPWPWAWRRTANDVELDSQVAVATAQC